MTDPHASLGDAPRPAIPDVAAPVAAGPAAQATPEPAAPDAAARETAQEASDARYRAIVDLAIDAIVTARDDGTVVAWNRAAADLFGYTADEMIGRSIATIIPAPVAETHEAALVRFRTTDERRLMGQTREETARHRDGTDVPVEISLSEWHAADGHYVTAIIRDVMQRREADRAARRLAAAIEETDDSVVVTDPDGTILYVNPAFERVTGYSIEEALGENPRILKSGHQDAAFYAALWATLGRGETWRGEFHNVRKDGSIYIEEASIAPVRDVDGKTVSYVAVKRDVTAQKAALDALETSRAELADAQRIAHVGSWRWDADTGAVTWSDEHFRIFGLEPGGPAPRFADQEELFTAESWLRLSAAIGLATRAGVGFEIPVEFIRRDGEVRHGISRGEAVRGPDDAITHIRGTFADVTEMRTAEAALRASEERFRLLAENSSDVIVHIRGGRIAWISPSVAAVLGGVEADWAGREFADLVHVDDRRALDEGAEANAAGTSIVQRIRVWAADGDFHWIELHASRFLDAAGQPDGRIASLRIVDVEVRAMDELDRLARVDTLTGLLNRGEGLHRLEEETERRRARGRALGILFCDVDRFKDVNDAHGHAAGDAVLRTLAQRIGESVRRDDVVARIGGDEMLVLLRGVRDVAEAARIAEKVRAAAAKPIAIPDGSVSISVSIGATVAVAGETADDLVARADAAMYEAKRSGRDQVVAFGGPAGA